MRPRTESTLRDHALALLAGVWGNQRKMRRYSGFCRATERPDLRWRDRRGSIFCQSEPRVPGARGEVRIRSICHCKGPGFRRVSARPRTPDVRAFQHPAPKSRAKGRFMASTYPLAPAPRAFALAAFLLASAVASAQDTDPVIARVNGVDIRQSDLAVAEDEIGSNMPQMTPDQKREYFITYLSDVVILAQAAEKQNVADRDDVKHRIAFARNKVLMEALLQDTGKAALTDDAMHKVYDEAVKSMPPEEEVHARHILVPTEDEAKEIEG